MRGTETIVVHRTAPTGRFGETPTGAADRSIDGCIIWPRTSTETTDNADTVVTGLDVWCPAGSDIKATDRVTARGDDYAVDGDPGDYRSSGGQPKGILVALRKVTG